jgi:hypothetical protein
VLDDIKKRWPYELTLGTAKKSDKVNKIAADIMTLFQKLHTYS